jgi:hypothetical protein
MKKIAVAAAAVALSAATLALTATGASAKVVCNQYGECWHVRHNYVYKPEFGLVVHENNWRWNASEKYRWREHSGRGYWRNGVWIRF